MTGVAVSALELFSIGIGPSSSHTVGPMRAASRFRARIEALGMRVTGYDVTLRGSLAATGLGHGTPDAVLAGLRGLDPETADPDAVHGRWARIASGGAVRVGDVPFDRSSLTFDLDRRDLPHPNTLVLRARTGATAVEATYLSVGGGFVVETASAGATAARPPVSRYRSAAELLEEAGAGRISDVAWADEVHWWGEDAAAAGLRRIWDAMDACIDAGLTAEGELPGALRVPRRARSAWARLSRHGRPEDAAEAVSIYAMAVNEENAAGRRVVTAPTNGAAGVVPAVLRASLAGRADDAHVREFLLTAAAIASLFAANASISGAVGGCQAEVGSACAMAAAGLTAVRGGTPAQVENAAEIALEHHLGLTCDPVGGLVQIPCIERNAVAAATAMTASSLALLGDGRHVVGLDTAIETMRQTGEDMSDRYKETAAGGLAVNVVEC
jgi:L-serine dehydratase